MKQVWRLTLTILRGSSFFSFGTDTGEREKPWKKALALAMAVLLVLYAAVASGVTAKVLFDLLSPLHLENLIPGLLISSLLSLSLVFAILYALGIFYHASDIDRLLPLPLSATTQISARILVTLSYLYRVTLMLSLPPLLVFGILNHSPGYYYPALVLVTLILPVIPLALGLVIVFALMRLAPLTHNKDRFKSISGLLLLVLAIGLSYSFSRLSSLPEEQVAKLLATRSEQIGSLTASFFPGASQAVTILTTTQASQAVGSLLVLVLITALSVLLALAVGRKLYFKGVIGLSTAQATSRRLSRQVLKQQLGDSPADRPGQHGRLVYRGAEAAFFTYLLKDLRILFRTPIFLVNNVIMNFLWPFFLGLPLLAAGSNDPDLAQLQALLEGLKSGQDAGAAPVLLAGFWGLALFVTGSSGIAESALSREGSQFYLMKTLPMSYTRQIAAKLAAAIVLNLAGLLLSLALLTFYLKLPASFVLLALLALPGALLLSNLSGIIFELHWPKLHWDNEQKAVKQNMNVLYGILTSVLFAGLVLTPVLLLKLTLLSTALVVILGPLILSAGLLAYLRRLIPRRMRAIPG